MKCFIFVFIFIKLLSEAFKGMDIAGNKPKIISAKHLELNLKNKLEETLGNKKKQEERGRNRKKQ